MVQKIFATHLLILCCVIPTLVLSDSMTPLIWLRGDSAVCRDVSVQLKKRGIALADEETLASVTVTLKRTNDGISVVLSDKSGHFEHRRAATSTSVVNMIDAWVQEGLLTPVAPSNEPEKDTKVAPSRIAGISMSVISGSAFDGALLFGGLIKGALHVGPVAIGPSVTAQVAPKLTGKAGRFDTTRTVVDLAVGISLPLRLAKWEVFPGVDVGAAFFYARKRGTVSVSTESEDDEEEAESDDRVSIVGLATFHAWEAALGASFVAVYPLGRGFSLALGLSARFYPGANTERRVDGATNLVLAGQPVGAAYLSIGLEFGI